MNFYHRNFYDDEFLDNEYFEIGGLTYPDAYLVNGYNYSVDLMLGLFGSNLRADYSGNVTGTVNAIFEFTFAGSPLWFADGISVSATAVFGAMSTVGNADDRALLKAILSGNDAVLLSNDSDRFEAGAGNDTVRAGGGNDMIYAGGGHDIVYGGAGSDGLLGGAGADRLSGGGGNDRIVGGSGGDDLSGGAGRDLLIGGASADVFVFSGRFGADTIRDFDADLRGERIDLSDVAAITSYRDLRANHLDQRGDDVVIDAGRGNSIRLADVDIGDLSANDFLF